VLAVLAGFRRFLETRMFGDRLEAVTALASAKELAAWAERPGPGGSDLGIYLRLAKALGLAHFGRASDRFLSYGAYALNGAHLFKRGVHAGGADQALDEAEITEDTSSGWFAPANGPSHPSRGATLPDADAKDGYTWCKAPRLAGHVVEVGALARQLVDGHPLIRDLVHASGGNVATRVIARLIEVARVVPALEQWTRAIVPHEPFYVDAPPLGEAAGAGLIEAARGSLGHWLNVKNGRIFNYQIVAPTTWNFSPRDASGTPGACEQALVGAPVREGEADPVAVQHIVRSFDPCMVCTVH
jgi:hydrogenase large subunit